MKIDIIIPVLNEETTLIKQIEIILSFIKAEISEQHQLSIVISDNGSTDKTEALSLDLVNQYQPDVRYVKVGKRGVGLALKTAWSESQADIVGYMDLDLATDIKHLHQVIGKFEDEACDIVYGSRLSRDSKVVGRTLKREVVSRLFNFIIKTYLHTSFSDGMCGFKFLRRSLLQDLLNNGAISDGWFFCTELLVVAEWHDKNLVELPVHWTDDPESKVNIRNLTFEYLSAMRQLKANFYKQRKNT